MIQEPTAEPDHRCGATLDYCLYNNETYFFCSYCKEVVAIMSFQIKSLSEFKIENIKYLSDDVKKELI